MTMMNISVYTEQVIQPFFDITESFFPLYIKILPLIILLAIISYILRAMLSGGEYEDSDEEISFGEFAKRRDNEFLSYSIKRENDLKEFYSKYKIK